MNNEDYWDSPIVGNVSGGSVVDSMWDAYKSPDNKLGHVWLAAVEATFILLLVILIIWLLAGSKDSIPQWFSTMVVVVGVVYAGTEIYHYVRMKAKGLKLPGVSQ